VYLAKIANRGRVSEKTYRRAVQMLSIVKDNPVSHGKDPNALAVAYIYAACLKEGEKVIQAPIVAAGDSSIVTLRKRFQNVRQIFPCFISVIPVYSILAPHIVSRLIYSGCFRLHAGEPKKNAPAHNKKRFIA
jgi:transcription initiation factor TFIIIB Brf1 subunit/transcription initiation factor TFIIB